MSENLQMKDTEEDLSEVKITNSDGLENSNNISTRDLKLDKLGLPLIPQPTDHNDDPLVSAPALPNDNTN